MDASVLNEEFLILFQLIEYDVSIVTEGAGKLK